MTEFIVRHTQDGTAEDNQPPGTEERFHLEPGLLPQSRRLNPSFPVAGWDSIYRQHLEKRIQRNPRDLLSHVQRVLMRDTAETDASGFGALVDLFLILGKRGRELRGNMLRRLQGGLTAEQVRFLTEHMDSGLKMTDPLPNMDAVRLSKGLHGTPSIVTRGDASPDDPVDPVVAANEYLAHADIDTARTVLEAALEADPGREDVCRTLLELYRNNNLRDAFTQTYSSFLSRRLALPELWNDTQRYFQQNNGDMGPNL